MRPTVTVLSCLSLLLLAAPFAVSAECPQPEEIAQLECPPPPQAPVVPQAPPPSSAPTESDSGGCKAARSKLGEAESAMRAADAGSSDGAKGNAAARLRDARRGVEASCPA